jgi:hypothetical protein
MITLSDTIEYEAAALQLRDLVAGHLVDISVDGVRIRDHFVLGAVDDGMGVQPRDLTVTVEIEGPAASSAAVRKRLGEAFHLLGERRIPGAYAFAAVVPPYQLVDGPETFTILWRGRDGSCTPLLYPSEPEGTDDRLSRLGLRCLS